MVNTVYALMLYQSNQILLNLLGSADMLPTVHASTEDAAQAINFLRPQLQQLDASSNVLTIQRMENQSIWNTAYGASPLLASPAQMHEYKQHMEATMKRASNSKEGYIVWLKLEGNPPLKEIHCKPIIPDNFKAIDEKLKAVARRLLDTKDARFQREDLTDQCSFKQVKLSIKEHAYAEKLLADPMQWARAIVENDDWDVLPFEKLDEIPPEVSSTVCVHKFIMQTSNCECYEYYMLC